MRKKNEYLAVKTIDVKVDLTHNRVMLTIETEKAVRTIVLSPGNAAEASRALMQAAEMCTVPIVTGDLD